MGVVYLAMDPLLSRQVAVKTVDLGVGDPQESEFLRSRLWRDARAAAVLKHPNIVAIYDVFEDAGRAFVVMEYIEGESLAARLKANPLPEPAMILRVLGQMAEALDYTHARGVVHRDIKPANVMIDSAGTAKILDFGIARISDARTCTPTGMVMGTVEYMAPEQILGQTADGQADQFALAVVAYQMMTGSTLFGPQTLATLTYKLVNEAPTPPCARNAALPRGVDAVLARGLAKTPAERFPTCRQFVAALAEAFSEAPTAPVVPAAAVSPPAQPVAAALATAAPAAAAKRSGSALLIAASVVVLAAGGLAVWKLRDRNSAQPAPVAVVAPAAPIPTTVNEPVAPLKTAPPTSPPKAHAGKPAESVSSAPKMEVPPAAPKAAEPTLHKKEEAVPLAEPQPPAAPPAGPVSAPPKAPPASAAPKAEPPEPFEAEMLPLPPAPKSAPTPYTTAMQRGQQQVKENDYPGALQSFTKAISLRADSAQARYSRGAVYEHLNGVEAAMRDFTEAIRLDPKMAQAHSGVGDCLVRLHRDPEALAEFQRAIELKPEAVLALSGRGGIYLRRKQYKLALADYDRALSINPAFIPAYVNRARAREALGDFAGAAADRRREAELRKR